MNPRVEWRKINGKRCLFLHFNGHFSAEHAREAVSTLGPMIKNEQGALCMIWECTNMEGFDMTAREHWQVFMKGIKSKIEKIHLVSDRLLIRSGALVVGIFTGIKITTWATITELDARGWIPADAG